ncbi:glutamyl-tRNA(Gln) amidotransferase subunit C, mitochondrial [Lycorma delicatula]|uniref:glutamyl-tRNA(Gln) amidotransferase subunit C, mitochondrial n=1 Tax=Lycorma delicatula TaxID=130591 RepID=UPI003F517BBE
MWYVRKCGLLRSHSFINNLHFFRFLNSKIPPIPVDHFTERSDFTKCKTIIDKYTVTHLEKLSLVDFGDEKGIKILEDAVEFADQLAAVNTDGVEPLITVLEGSELRLREDIVTDGKCCSKILSNAAITEDDYFIAPPGNIPVTPKKYDSDLLKGSNENENIGKTLKQKAS